MHFIINHNTPIKSRFWVSLSESALVTRMESAQLGCLNLPLSLNSLKTPGTANAGCRIWITTQCWIHIQFCNRQEYTNRYIRFTSIQFESRQFTNLKNALTFKRWNVSPLHFFLICSQCSKDWFWQWESIRTCKLITKEWLS